MEFMQSQSDKSFDLAIVDPPYGIDYAAKPARSKHEKKNWDNDIPNDIYFDELFRIILIMKIDCIIGIDPGAAGGIVVWRPNHNATAIKMPKDINDIRDLFNYYKEICTPIIFLEKLSVRPDDVTVGDAGANMGKLYRIQKMLQNFEHLKAIITVAEIPFVLVNAMKWQNDLKLRIKVKGKKEEKADRKRRFRDIAGKLYPEITPALWNADATLIMHFGRFILQNNPRWVLENLPQQMHNRLF